MKDFDVVAARASLARREARRKALLDARREQAQRDFDRIVEYLVRDFRPLRIYQWGSLLRTERFSEISDIDVAIEGLDDPLAGLHAAAGAERLTDFPVDLVELERIHPVYAAGIRQEGKLVYERG